MVKLEMIHKLQCLDASINGAENYRPVILRGVIPKNCNFSHWRLRRPWLSPWESCQPNRLTERVLRLMVGSVHWNVGPSQAAPYGAASSPRGRAKVASLRRNDTAKLQFSDADTHIQKIPSGAVAPEGCLCNHQAISLTVMVTSGMASVPLSTTISPDLICSFTALYSSTVTFCRLQVSVGRPTYSPSSRPKLLTLPP